MQKSVKDLLNLGPLLSEDDPDATPESYDQYDLLSLQIEKPVTQEEAEALITLLGNDSCYGIAWTLIHAIETAPTYTIDEKLLDKEMVQELLARFKNTE